MNTKLNRPSAWRDARVFLVLLYINYALLGCAVVLMFIDYPSGSMHKVWLWVVATPASIAMEFRQTDLVGWFLFLNPIINAATWWLVWRIWRLFRRKPE